MAPFAGLSLEARARRSELAYQAEQDRDRAKLAFDGAKKTWKLRDDNFAELIARLHREAATGTDEGGQLSLPGVEAAPAAAPVLPAWYPQMVPLRTPKVSFEDLGVPRDARALQEWLCKRNDAESDETEIEIVDTAVLAEALPQLSPEARLAAALWLRHTGHLEPVRGIEGFEFRVERTDARCETPEARELCSELLDTLPALGATEKDLGAELCWPPEIVSAMALQLAARGTLVRSGERVEWAARNLGLEGLILGTLRHGRIDKRHLSYQLDVGQDELEASLFMLLALGAVDVIGDKLVFVPEDKREPESTESLDRRVLGAARAEGRPMSVKFTAQHLRLPMRTVCEAMERLCAAGKLTKAAQPGGTSLAEGPWYQKAKKGQGNADEKPTGKEAKKPAKKKSREPQAAQAQEPPPEEPLPWQDTAAAAAAAPDTSDGAVPDEGGALTH